MSVIEAKEIPEILKGLGWTPKALDEHTWWCEPTTLAGPVGVVIRHGGAWLYLSVLPFLEPAKILPWGVGKYPPGFLGRILAVNHNLVLVKFALDEDGDLSLRTEIPTESLQRRELETAATTLLRTTEQYRTPILDALLEASRRLTDPEDPGRLMPTIPAPPDDDDDGSTEVDPEK